MLCLKSFLYKRLAWGMSVMATAVAFEDVPLFSQRSQLQADCILAFYFNRILVADFILRRRL